MCGPQTYTLDLNSSKLTLGFDATPGKSPGYTARPNLTISGTIEGTVYLFKGSCPSESSSGNIGVSTDASISPNVNLSLGAQDLYVSQQEAVTENWSECSDPLRYIYDDSVATPNITSTISDSSSPNLSISIDNYEANATLYLTSACQSISALNAGETLSSPVPLASGANPLTYTVPENAQAPTTYYLRQVDAAGNVSACVSFNYDYDKTINAPSFAFDTGAAAHPSATQSDDTDSANPYNLLTSNAHVLSLSLSGDPDITTTKYFLGGTCAGGVVDSDADDVSSLINSDGKLDLVSKICNGGTASVHCADDDYVIFVQQTDNAGNTVCSDPITYTYDDELAAPVLSLGPDNPSSPVNNVSDIDFGLATDSDIATKTLYLGETCTSGVSSGVSLGSTFEGLDLATQYCEEETERTDLTCTKSFTLWL